MLEAAALDERCPAFAVAAATLQVLVDHFGSQPVLPTGGAALHADLTARPNADPPAGPCILQLDQAGMLDIGIIPTCPCGDACPLTEHNLQQGLTIGCTALPFCVADILGLLNPGSSLISFGEAAALCPELGRWCQDHIFHGLALERATCPFGDILCYTDGSFTEGGARCPAYCGWACIFLDPHRCQVSCLLGAFPEMLADSSFVPSPFQGECAALLAAALSSTASLGDRTIHYRSDCTSAIAIAAGQAAYESGGFSQALRHAHSFRQTALDRPDTHEHVRGHQGTMGNELAGALSKHGAWACSATHLW